MEFGSGPGADELRAEVRAFVAEQLTDAVREQVAVTGNYHSAPVHEALAGRRWIAPHWPVEHGGQGWDRSRTDIIYTELAAAGVPVEGLAITLIVGEAIRRAGTAEQQSRILPGVCAGSVVMALGYSEPGAGSDLAAVRTAAARDGGDWIINGQKIFTTLASEADYVFLLARSEPDAARHAGLTLFLVPTTAEGFSATPLFTLSGQRTNMTYYSDVRVPDEARIGGPGQGWEIVSMALAFERGGEFAAQLRRLVTAAVGWGKQAGLDGDHGFLSRLGRAVVATEASRVLGAQASWSRTAARAGAVEGAIAKVYGTESLLRESRSLVEAAGARALARRGAGAAADGELQHLYREAQIATIYGGTSEVLKSLIAQQRLGLPRGGRPPAGQSGT